MNIFLPSSTPLKNYFNYYNSQEKMVEKNMEYFKCIFGLLKELAFHQIYMESCRQDLARDEDFDPHTAFKCLDHFKHNRVIAYELHSLFDLHQIPSTIEECEIVIQAIDKSLSQLDYETFEQMVLPRNITLKNMSRTRFNHTKIQVGSYSKLTYVKEHTEHCIVLFLEKQLNFYRHYLSSRQQFMRQWGGDVYTMLQHLFKSINYRGLLSLGWSQFYQIGRQIGLIFNQVQFQGIWRRSKSRKTTLEDHIDNIRLTYEQLHGILLVRNLKTKVKYALEQNVPLSKALQRSTPSYHTSHWSQHEKWQAQQKKNQLEEMEQKLNYKLPNMKYKYSSWQALQDPLCLRGYFKQKSQDWSSTVDKMTENQLEKAYYQATKRSILFPR